MKGKKSKKSKSTGTKTVARADPIRGNSEYTAPLAPGQKLVEVLTTHEVTEKELFGFKVSTRALEQLTPIEIKDLRLVFDTFDVHSREMLGPTEVRKALRCLGFKRSREEARELVHDIGVNTAGFANFNEFLDIIIQLQGDSRDIYEEIRQGFQLLDYDGNSKISMDNVRKGCDNAGVKFTKQELDNMFEEADLNGDGFIDLDEFTKIMLRTNLF